MIFDGLSTSFACARVGHKDFQRRHFTPQKIPGIVLQGGLPSPARQSVADFDVVSDLQLIDVYTITAVLDKFDRYVLFICAVFGLNHNLSLPKALLPISFLLVDEVHVSCDFITHDDRNLLQKNGKSVMLPC